MTDYFRPIPMTDLHRPPDALPLAGGALWFDRVERLSRNAPPELLAASDLTGADQARLSAPRADFAGLSMASPRIMGIVNVTPDSFSDGGKYKTAAVAVQAAAQMAAEGADILDVGGESTRPGAATVAETEEIGRVVPVIAGIRTISSVPVSIDTRKAAVAQTAIDAGADIINDVTAMNYDPEMGAVMAKTGAPVVLMHSAGSPETMQDDPRYDNVLLDVYDALADAVERAQAAGIARERIVVDPGIGFGKTLAHNLALLQGIAVFHNLGCPVLLGASRKRFIGTIGQADEAGERLPGSLAVALAALGQGVQILRVHDIRETRQAMRLWAAATGTVPDA